jgi:hypothetical protein
MTVARTRHTATLLQDGRVLIAGGSGKSWGSPSLASAELFDPSTGKFTSTGSMHVARAGHTATLLKDGRVLITGGHSTALGSPWTNAGSTAPDMGLPLASAELYDPATGKFTLTGSMTAARDSHSATLLADGRVLIAGGYDCSEINSCNDLMSAELYDPATGTFTPTGSIEACGGPATILNDGRVLVVDGCEGSAQLYDPAKGTFGRWPIDWSYDMPGATSDAVGSLSLLKDGRVLLTGGYKQVPESAPRLLNAAYVYDPSTGRFSPTGSMAKARARHSTTLLPDGRVLVAGGGDFLWCRAHSCHSTDSSSAELYNPATGEFGLAPPMNVGRFNHTATLLRDGRVLIAGGYGGASSGACLASAELYIP